MDTTTVTEMIKKLLNLNGITNMFIRNPEHVYEVLNKIKLDCPSKLQVIADFDWTLSNFDHHEKDRNPTSFDILQDSGYFSLEVKAKCDEMKNHYLPLLMDNDVSVSQKTSFMHEWWRKYNDIVLSNTNIHISQIKEIVKNSNCMFRHNADEFFTLCNEKKIPLSIVSAGIGDIIEEVLIQNINISFSNIKVISNFLDFNEKSNTVCFKRDIIHVYNKNEALAADKEHLKLINDRTNVILMGDSEGDHEMAENLENVKNIIKIGFLNSHIDTHLEKFQRLFDIVLVKDSTLDVLIKILKYFLF